MTREQITKLTATDPGYTISALLALYEFQEADEKVMGHTTHQNNRGFNGADAPILTDMVSFYQQRGGR